MGFVFQMVAMKCLLGCGGFQEYGRSSQFGVEGLELSLVSHKEKLFSTVLHVGCPGPGLELNNAFLELKTQLLGWIIKSVFLGAVMGD
jgi:hypothetical protein